MLAASSRELPLDLDDVVLVFACNELFVPYLSVALQSILVNASPKRHYDIVVLTRYITPKSMITLTQQASKYGVGLGFLDVDAALGDIKLPHHGHFRPETYFRLLAPTLLDNVDKAIYLDSDIVVCADVAELFDTDVTGHLLAATRDADTIGQIDGYDPTVYSYLKDQLGMTEPHDYFQAGVLLMNLGEFRQTITAEELLDIATERTWRWLDQDVLNKVVDGHYRRVHMKWNYLVDWQYMRRTHIVAQAPEDVQEEYDEAGETIASYTTPAQTTGPGSTQTRTSRASSGSTRRARPTWSTCATSLRSPAGPLTAWRDASRPWQSTVASCMRSTTPAPREPSGARSSSSTTSATAGRWAKGCRRRCRGERSRAEGPQSPAACAPCRKEVRYIEEGGLQSLQGVYPLLTASASVIERVRFPEVAGQL